MSRFWADVTPYADKAVARDVVARRRHVIPPVPGLTISQAFRVQTTLFAQFGLERYLGQVSAEMYQRPCPHVSEYSGKLVKLTKLCEELLPQLFAFVADKIVPPIQTYNKVSRMGWPFFNRPEDKASRAIWAYDTTKAHPEYLDPAFTTPNIRLQPEDKDKRRTLQFIDDKGDVSEQEVGSDERTIWTQDLGEVLAQRTRLVFNKPANNLALQIVDTAINNVWGSYPVCAHNMYDVQKTPNVRRFVLPLDVRHMERFTAAIIATRTAIIGANYQKQHEAMDKAGFLVPSRTWRTWWHLRKVAEGMLVQFGSGHSAVAPSQKEALICILWAMHVKVWGMDKWAALRAVLAGDTPFLHIMNYGDDNFWSAHDQALLDQAFEFASQYLEVEIESPPKFLGFVWTPERRFRLPGSSYLLKTYLHERAPLSTFRKYPYFGWVEKRKVFMQFGDAGELGRIFDAENRELDAVGLPWSTIERRALDDAAALKEGKPSPNALFGKDYLMTAEEKIESGAFDGLYPDVTGPLLRDMVDASIFH